MTDLERRLERFPSDLEPFFKYMLDIVEPVYHKLMAWTLRIAINAKSPLILEVYKAVEFEEETKNYAMFKDMDIARLEISESSLRHCRKRINVRCGGLLEVNKGSVDFLHRTVRDFLRTREINDYFLEKSGVDFMVNLSTFKAFVFLHRYWCWDRLSDVSLPGLAQNVSKTMFEYAYDAIEECADTAINHLDSIEDLYRFLFHERHSVPDRMPNNPEIMRLRSSMISRGIHNYVAIKLEQQPEAFDGLPEKELMIPLEVKEFGLSDARMMIQLLKSDQNPNDGDELSPWHRFIEKTCTNSDNPGPQSPFAEKENRFSWAVELSLFSVFLKCGSKRTMQIREGRDIWFPTTWFVKALCDYEHSSKTFAHCLRTLEDMLGGTQNEQMCQMKDIVQMLDISMKENGLLGETWLGRGAETMRFHGAIIERSIKKGWK